MTTLVAALVAPADAATTPVVPAKFNPSISLSRKHTVSGAAVVVPSRTVPRDKWMSSTTQCDPRIFQIMSLLLVAGLMLCVIVGSVVPLPTIHTLFPTAPFRVHVRPPTP